MSSYLFFRGVYSHFKQCSLDFPFGNAKTKKVQDKKENKKQTERTNNFLRTKTRTTT